MIYHHEALCRPLRAGVRPLASAPCAGAHTPSRGFTPPAAGRCPSISFGARGRSSMPNWICHLLRARARTALLGARGAHQHGVSARCLLPATLHVRVGPGGRAPPPSTSILAAQSLLVLYASAPLLQSPLARRTHSGRMGQDLERAGGQELPGGSCYFAPPHLQAQGQRCNHVALTAREPRGGDSDKGPGVKVTLTPSRGTWCPI
jgi:hypothetical protein